MEQSEIVPAIKDITELTLSFRNETRNTLQFMARELQINLKSLQCVQDDTSAFSKFAEKLQEYTNSARDRRIVFSILQSLYFKQMKERRSSIPEAHSKTFEWIFDDLTEFEKWLQSANGMFWIAGKAGSGKSTLMKFIHTHSKVASSLLRWAGNSPLLVASHFFWSAGTKLQKSQDGLLRTLLYQIFALEPELIPLISPWRWKALSETHLSEGWDRSELIEAFKRLGEVVSGGRHPKICIFVDGLDEYDGDHLELITTLRAMTQSPNIKICAASRPWQDFKDAFAPSQWKIYV